MCLQHRQGCQQTLKTLNSLEFRKGTLKALKTLKIDLGNLGIFLCVCQKIFLSTKLSGLRTNWLWVRVQLQSLILVMLLIHKMYYFARFYLTFFIIVADRLLKIHCLIFSLGLGQ